MSGARTVDLNAGQPGARRRRSTGACACGAGWPKFNLRIIVSGSGSINPDAEIFRHQFSPIIILTTRRAPARPAEGAARSRGGSQGLRREGN